MSSRDHASDHAHHDRLLVAAQVAGDLDPAEHDRMAARIADCPACAELARDLATIRAATTAANLPVPPRPRPFTLAPSDAARLRPAGWRGLVRRFGSPGWAFTRPLAAGLTTLGLAGLLVAALPTGFMGGSAAAGPAAREAAHERSLMTYQGAPSSPGAQPSFATAPSEAPASAAPLPAGSAPTASGNPKPSDSAVGTLGTDVKGEPGDAGGVDNTSSPSPGTALGGSDGLTQGPGNDEAEAPTVAARDGSILLAIVAGTAILVGLGLFGLRWAARRLA